MTGSHWGIGHDVEQQVVTLRVCASRWTEVCGFIGSWGKKQTKMAGVLKIIIIFVIFSLSVECRKDKLKFYQSLHIDLRKFWIKILIKNVEVLVKWS